MTKSWSILRKQLKVSKLRRIIRESLQVNEAKISNWGLTNTIFSDMNEILMASALMGGTSLEDVGSTVGADALEQVNGRVEMIRDAVLEGGGTESEAEARIQVELNNGQVMADAVLDWAAANDYGVPQRVYWTARPNALQQAMDDAGTGLDATKGHPADVAVAFDSGKVLGISAKATKGKSDIAFKNPGWGTLAKALGINPLLAAGAMDNEIAKIDPEALEMSKRDRKAWLRSDPAMKDQAGQMGRVVLNVIRDAILTELKSLTPEEMQEFILRQLMDAGSAIVPDYIKVTALGGGQSAKVSDPTNNPMLDAVQAGEIDVQPRGDDAIVFVDGGGSPILQLRAKFESQPLASSIKFSAEPAAKKSRR